MSSCEINYSNLRDIDSYLHVDDPDRLDDEIEEIVANLWKDIGSCEELLSPFFSSYLQTNLLRPLYIHYLALRELKCLHNKVLVNASTVVIDVVAKNLGLELNPDRSFHDEEFFLVYHYDFSGANNRPYWKRALISLYGAFIVPVRRLTGLDVLYMNAGKLDADLSGIPRAMSAFRIPQRNSKRLDCDVVAIGNQVRKNIRSMTLSIPNECVVELVERRVLAYLPDMLNRIGVLTDFIEKCRAKLAIASAVTHEDHLCLLAAAKLAGIESLVMSHGFTYVHNPFLGYYVTNQATLNNIEPRYEGAAQFSMKANWFERKI